ncbi:T9SS sorting signal type C domain-containing protein [Flavobacterium sp. CLA17]|uniref:T9SS sorting signal type C domain-containing protein n=1 Tax=Flavobacterium sp. CLA17 TaxID=2724135 RepID=UPI00149104A3|nr:T9SS sorting signal type C domain-containing protein [Flavobacterium sp. CLA17]QSB27503.1 T9SS sorting signal type C domain-containing protein [Flavobacterium sp. CLA17]
MKKKLPSFLFSFSMHCSSQANLHYLEIPFFKAKLSFLFLFVFASSVAQTISHTYTTNTSVFVPPGLSTMTVQAWGAGGAGGGSSVPGGGFGRGGAGGGGGAYATATISVSTLTNTNISLVVGAQTAGTTGNGANGASSTITGFETVILAVGGSGGTANTTGGSPAGGTGGQASASFGNPATKTSGSNGDPGGTSLLSLLFSSGKGGTGALPGGGAGGAAIASVILGVNSVGNNGTGPGGGGGGAMTAGSGGPLAGGAGAQGQIKIDYTCPTYSITGISAANACTLAGTSLVTLTGSAASLPVGTYTVTYNRSNPTGTALIATLTVAVAGTGTFTAVGLTAAGTPTITVTNLASGECTSTIGSNNVANLTVFGPTAGGAVTGTSPICSGATSGLLTLSGHTGTILNWESSVSPFSTWTNISNTTTTYTSGPLTATTQFRAIVQNGPCASTPSTPVTITVNPLPQGSLTANGPFCATGAGQLTFTATAGTGPYTIVYKENGGADRTATNVTSGTPFATFTTPVIASTTYTLVSVTGANTCVRSSVFTGGSATITVNPLPQGSLTANGPFCATGAGQLTFTATAGTGPYTIVYKENGGADRTATNVTSGTPFATFTTPVIASTTYTLVSVTGSNSCVRSSGFTGGAATITINPIPATPINGGITQPTCALQTGTIVLTGLPNISNYTIVQTGFSSNTYNGGSGPDPTTYTVTGLAAGTYNFTVQYTGSCVSSSLSNITINPLITNTYTIAGGWSNGTPTINQNVIFADNYAITGDLNSCTCKVNPGIKITVTALNTLTVNNGLIVDSALGTELIFENNSSLIQINNNPGINSGAITYKRTAKQILLADFVYWSTPVSPQTLFDVSPFTLADKYFGYNGTNWVITPGNTTMVVGKGYIIRGPQTYSNGTREDYTASFNGVPNNGTLSGEIMDAGKSYLIGNPYPSALDADLFLDANLFLDGTIFFWTHNTPVGTAAQYEYSDDDYASYNRSGGVGISAKSSPGHTDNPATDAGVKPTGKIAAGQSFFATTVNSGTPVFNNTMRLGGTSNNQFFKTANTSKKADLERHRLWLNMTNEGGAFKQLLVGYIEEATNGFDNRFDGITLDANPFLDFYSINGTYKYVIQGRALPFSDTDTVPLGYRSAIVSDFTISIDDSDGNLVNQAIYIEDKVTGLVHNLRDSNYTFSSAIGVFDNRFILRYKDTSLGIDEFENSGKEMIISTKDKTISIYAPEKIINEILIYDVTGNMIYKKSDLNDPAFQIVNLRSQNQVLLVKVKLADNTISTRKVIF